MNKIFMIACYFSFSFYRKERFCHSQLSSESRELKKLTPIRHV